MKPEWNPVDNPRLTWLGFEAADEMVREAESTVRLAGSFSKPPTMQKNKDGQMVEVMEDGRVPHAARDKVYGLAWLRGNKKEGKKRFRDIYIHLLEVGTGGVLQELEGFHGKMDGVPWRIGPDPLYEFILDVINNAKRPTDRNDGVSGGDPDDTNGTGSSRGAQRARDVRHLAYMYKQNELVGICNDWAGDVAEDPRAAAGAVGDKMMNERKKPEQPGKPPPTNATTKRAEDPLHPEFKGMVQHVSDVFAARNQATNPSVQSGNNTELVQAITAMVQSNQQQNQQTNQMMMGVLHHSQQLIQHLMQQPGQTIPPPGQATSSGWQATFQPPQAADEAAQPQPQPGQATEVLDLDALDNNLDDEAKQQLMKKWAKELKKI